jgi:hypothetical protein
MTDDDEDPDFAEVDEPKLDEATVLALRKALADCVMGVMRPHMEAGRGNPAVLEWLNVLGLVLAHNFAGTGWHPKAFAFFRRALADNLLDAAAHHQDDALTARILGRPIVPPWLEYGRVPRFTIDEKGFRRLVAGETVILASPVDEPVYVILKDIGYGTMTDAIEAAKDG